MSDQTETGGHDPEEPTGLVPARDRWKGGDGVKPYRGHDPKRELLKRLQSAVILIAVAFGALAIGGFLFGLIAVLFGVAMVLEWDRLTGDPHNPRPISFILLFLIAAEITRWQVGLPWGLGVAGVGALIGVVFGFRFRKGEALWDRLTIAFGILYIALPIMLLIEMRDSVNGFALVTLIFLVTWGMDSGAYASGKLIGGPKLAPKMSPGKTWAGLIGGMITAGLVAVAVVQFPTDMLDGFAALPEQILPGQPVWMFAIAMAVIGGLSQIGDMFESWLKRRRGVKDSGNLIPGHGGVLDRMDGLVVTMTCVSLFVLL